MKLKDLIFALAFFASRCAAYTIETTDGAEYKLYEGKCKNGDDLLCVGDNQEKCYCIHETLPAIKYKHDLVGYVPSHTVTYGHESKNALVAAVEKLNNNAAMDSYERYAEYVLRAIGDALPTLDRLDAILKEVSECDSDSPTACLQQSKIFIEQVVNFTSLRLKKIQAMNDQLKKMEDVARKVLAAYPELSEDAEIQAVLRKNIEDIAECRAL
jgi:hypothetical protein